MKSPSAPLTEAKKLAWGALLISHSRLTREIDRQMRKEGLTGLDVYDVLLVLEDAPNRSMRMIDLEQRVVFSPSGLTRLVDRLQKLGLVERLAHPTDRRSSLAVLTDKGYAFRQSAWSR